MTPGLEAALQADRGQIYAVMLLITVPQFVVTLGAIIFWIVRSRTKITEDRSKADIAAQQQRESADLEERRQLNEAFRSVIRLVDNKDQQLSAISQREAELRKSYEEFQRSFLALSEVRTGQLDKMIEKASQQIETEEVVRETVTKAESEIRAHAERSLPAIEIVKELPTTLQRIEESLKHLDEQLKAIPAALKNEIAPLMKTVDDLKLNVEELSLEAKRVTDTILPLIALPQPPIIEAFGPAIIDVGKTQPVDTAGIIAPFITDAQVDANGIVKSSGTVPPAGASI